MGVLEAIILGIIQGLTEFLPVSSSGHLELAKAIIGDDLEPDQSLLFTILVHAATAISTLVIFRKDVAEIIRGLFAFKWNEELKFSLKIILSMIPAAFIGLFFEKEIDGFFNGNIVLVGCMLILTGLLLFLADKAKNTNKDVNFSKALIIGISQAIAILPGISRSGATISTSVLLGVDRTRAARFSFLMVVPLIIGAMTVKAKDYRDIQALNEMNAEGRTEVILTEVQKKNNILDNEKVIIGNIISGKEVAWEKLKNSDSDSQEDLKASYEQLKLTFHQTLEKEGLPSDLISVIEQNDYSRVRSISSPNLFALLAGFIAAFLTGLVACQWMISLVKKSKLVYFSIYCVLVGIIAIGTSLF